MTREEIQEIILEYGMDSDRQTALKKALQEEENAQTLIEMYRELFYSGKEEIDTLWETNERLKEEVSKHENLDEELRKAHNAHHKIFCEKEDYRLRVLRLEKVVVEMAIEKIK